MGCGEPGWEDLVRLARVERAKYPEQVDMVEAELARRGVTEVTGEGYFVNLSSRHGKKRWFAGFDATELSKASITLGIVGLAIPVVSPLAIYLGWRAYAADSGRNKSNSFKLWAGIILGMPGSLLLGLFLVMCASYVINEGIALKSPARLVVGIIWLLIVTTFLIVGPSWVVSALMRRVNTDSAARGRPAAYEVCWAD